MAEFRMPMLGADMEAGTLVAWKKQPGDRVTRGDILAEVDTDKAVIEVEVFATGTLEEIRVQPGEKVPVGTVLAIIREDGVAPVEKVEAGTQAQGQSEPIRLRISPAARRRAQELGIDPATVRGSGADGAVTIRDIEDAVAQARGTGREAEGAGPPPSPTPSSEALAPGLAKPALAPVADAVTEKQGRMRQAIAAAMARAKREIPHYYLSTTIDLTPAVRWLREENARRAVTSRLLSGVLLIKAVALALREVPELNTIWKEGRPVRSEAVHIGVAISLRGGGLVAPALHDADRQTLDTLMQRLQDLVTRARAGTLRSSELSDPTITVTNLGEQGVETVFGVIYPPQVALVGFGKIVERPWVVDGQVQPRLLVSASLSADHRVSDGHRGGLFLAAVDRLLQQPEFL